MTQLGQTVGPLNDAITLRNAARGSTGGDSFKEEVMADILASYLFAPQLLGVKNDWAGWVENILPAYIK